MIKVHGDIQALLDRVLDKARLKESSAIGVLIDEGEHFLDVAFNDKHFSDITGNLRSSIGYGVYAGGEPLRIGGFQPTAAPKGDGSEGIARGRALLQNVADKHKRGVVLITVAGMSYSVIKEAEGKPVITHAQLSVEKHLNKRFRE